MGPNSFGKEVRSCRACVVPMPAERWRDKWFLPRQSRCAVAGIYQQKHDTGGPSSIHHTEGSQSFRRWQEESDHSGPSVDEKLAMPKVTAAVRMLGAGFFSRRLSLERELANWKSMMLPPWWQKSMIRMNHSMFLVLKLRKNWMMTMPYMFSPRKGTKMLFWSQTSKPQRPMCSNQTKNSPVRSTHIQKRDAAWVRRWNPEGFGHHKRVSSKASARAWRGSFRRDIGPIASRCNSESWQQHADFVEK